MGSEKVLGVSLEVEDRKKLRIGDFLKAGEGQITLGGKRQVLLREEDGVLEQSVPLGNLLVAVVEENVLQSVCNGRV